jgi:hypothetical protein
VTLTAVPEASPVAIKFYFDVIEGEEITHDDEGVTLPEVDAALRMARTAAAEIARDVFSIGEVDQFTIEVRTAERIIARAIVYLRIERLEA